MKIKRLLLSNGRFWPKADIQMFGAVRELCESVLMGCDESWDVQRASAESI